jgi:hypothetical protein
MDIQTKAQEILRLTIEVVEEAKRHNNKQLADSFETFGDDFISRARLLSN